MFYPKHLPVFGLIVALALQGVLYAQSKPSHSSGKIVATEKSLDFTLYTFEIVTLRDKESSPSYRQFRLSIKATENVDAQTLWKLNSTQATELLAYLKKFEEMRVSESSKSGATVQTRIGRVENTDLYFQLTPVSSAYLKIADRTAPEVTTRIAYNDLQAMRRLLLEFVSAEN